MLMYVMSFPILASSGATRAFGNWVARTDRYALIKATDAFAFPITTSRVGDPTLSKRGCCYFIIRYIRNSYTATLR